MRELANCINRIVIVKGEQIAPLENGYDSPTSFNAALALAVKMARYSAGSALKKSKMELCALSTSWVAASDVGLDECGLPKTCSCSN